MATKEKINLLEVVPCRNEHISTLKEGEEVILSFPRFKRAWMNRYLLPKGMSKDIQVRLEEHGATVWEMIDGKCTVNEIIEQLREHFQNEPDYETRVTQYLLQLHKDGFIQWIAKI